MIKIFYVEDEPFLGRIVKESLESRGYEVVMASDGRDAVGKFESAQPDICVLDVMLPHQDGYSIAQQIRKIHPTMPIIFVTAKTQTQDLLKGFEVGGNDYLRKPFSMEELIVRINNLLRLTQPANKAQKQEVIQIGQYEFNALRYELKWGNHVRKLSHREASLLHVLADHQNATVSRKDVLMRVWGDDSFFNSRNLDVYISKLRDYLKEDAHLEITTIKGVGYHFSVR
ncbi:MAG: response regulator transcription factor [Cytophagales bacterium]